MCYIVTTARRKYNNSRTIKNKEKEEDQRQKVKQHHFERKLILKELY